MLLDEEEDVAEFTPCITVDVDEELEGADDVTFLEASPPPRRVFRQATLHRYVQSSDTVSESSAFESHERRLSESRDRRRVSARETVNDSLRLLLKIKEAEPSFSIENAFDKLVDKPTAVPKPKAVAAVEASSERRVQVVADAANTELHKNYTFNYKLWHYTEAKASKNMKDSAGAGM